MNYTLKRQQKKVEKPRISCKECHLTKGDCGTCRYCRHKFCRACSYSCENCPYRICMDCTRDGYSLYCHKCELAACSDCITDGFMFDEKLNDGTWNAEDVCKSCDDSKLCFSCEEPTLGNRLCNECNQYFCAECVHFNPTNSYTCKECDKKMWRVLKDCFDC